MNGVESSWPPGVMMRTAPPCSVTKSLPSGANFIPVGLESPVTYDLSIWNVLL